MINSKHELAFFLAYIQFDILYKQFPDIDWSLVDPPPKKWWSKDGQKPKVEFIKYDDPPVAMSPIKPDPEFEISVNYDGIIIQTYINDEGFVTKTIILVGSPNSELNQEAMRSIRMTRFKPAKLRRKSLGFWRRKSIGVWVSIPFNFPNGVPIK